SHTFLGTYGAVWRDDGWGLAWLLVQLAALAVTVRAGLAAARARPAVQLRRGRIDSVACAHLRLGPARVRKRTARLGGGVRRDPAITRGAATCPAEFRRRRLLCALRWRDRLGAAAVRLLRRLRPGLP